MPVTSLMCWSMGLCMRRQSWFTALVMFPGPETCTYEGPRVVQQECSPLGHEHTWPQPLCHRPSTDTKTLPLLSPLITNPKGSKKARWSPGDAHSAIKRLFILMPWGEEE